MEHRSYSLQGADQIYRKAYLQRTAAVLRFLSSFTNFPTFLLDHSVPMDNKPITFFKPGTQQSPPPFPAHFYDQARALNEYINGPDLLLTKLTAVYRFLDSLASHVAQFTTCTKGCSHCCRMDVQITTFEAAYVEVHTKVPALQQGPLTTGHEGPCPFLTAANECGIYEVRPIICRTYHALSDPALCAERPTKQYDYGSTAQTGNTFYNNLLHWVHFQNVEVEGRVKDIRDFFPHDRAAIQTHLARARHASA